MCEVEVELVRTEDDAELTEKLSGLCLTFNVIQ